MMHAEMARGGVSPTLTGDHQDRVTDYTAIVIEIDENTDVETLLPWGRGRDQRNAAE